MAINSGKFFSQIAHVKSGTSDAATALNKRKIGPRILSQKNIGLPSFKRVLANANAGRPQRPASTTATSPVITPNVQQSVPAKTMSINVDLNNDGAVDFKDVTAQLANASANNAASDHNKDGTVDQKDMDILMSFWGTGGRAEMASPDVDGNGVVEFADVTALLARATMDDSAQRAAVDFNGDGQINQKDVDIVKAFFNQNIA